MGYFKRDKIFCIGTGKTGTTSVEKALKDFGYKMGDQGKGEMLLQDYSSRNFEKIIKFCKSADAFQDAPFCFKYTYIPLDLAFPGSRFVLTVRDSADQWYRSLCAFHAKLYGQERLPNEEDLRKAKYRYPGYAWDVRQLIYGIRSGENPYDEKILKRYYEEHNSAVIDYFKHKKNLLIINLSDKNSYREFCEFIGREPLYSEFPWENKTAEIKIV